MSGLDGPGVGSFGGRGKMPDVSILIGSGLLPFGGDSVEVARGAKSPDDVGGGRLDDGLSGAVDPASRVDAVESWRSDVGSVERISSSTGWAKGWWLSSTTSSCCGERLPGGELRR